MARWLTIGVMLLVFTLGLGACGGDDHGCGDICNKYRECNVTFEAGYTNDQCEKLCEDGIEQGPLPAAWRCKIKNCSNSTCDTFSTCVSDDSVQKCVYGE